MHRKWIKLENILHNGDKEYFCEMTIGLSIGGMSSKNAACIPIGLRCRIIFDCLLQSDSTIEWDGVSNEKISVVFPSALEMISLVLDDDTIALENEMFITPELWKALLYYCQVYLGVMQKSPVQFSLANADAASRLFDKFPEYLRWIVDAPDLNTAQHRLSFQSLGWRTTNTLFEDGNDLHFTLVQERLGTRPDNAAWWNGDLQMHNNQTAVGFLPVPAHLQTSDIENPDQNAILCFYDSIGNSYLAGTLTAFLPRNFPEWNKKGSMLPEPMNPDFVENGIKKNQFLDLSTINGFFNRVTNCLDGLYAKTRTFGSVISSLLVMAKEHADRIKNAERHIEAFQEFSPIGTIISYAGNQWSNDPILSEYFLPCDGRTVDARPDNTGKRAYYQDYFDWVERTESWRLKLTDTVYITPDISRTRTALSSSDYEVTEIEPDNENPPQFEWVMGTQDNRRQISLAIKNIGPNYPFQTTGNQADTILQSGRTYSVKPHKAGENSSVSMHLGESSTGIPREATGMNEEVSVAGSSGVTSLIGYQVRFFIKARKASRF